MGVSVKVNKIYPDFTLKMVKESKYSTSTWFSNAPKSLKQGVGSIGVSSLSSKLSNLGDNITLKQAEEPLKANLGALIGAITSVVSEITNKSKEIRDQFFKDNGILAKIIEKAEGLKVSVGEYEKLKAFAKEKGMDFGLLEHVMTNISSLSSKVQEVGGYANEQTKLFVEIMKGNGAKYSNYEKLEILLHRFMQVKDQKGPEEALNKLSKLFPMLRKEPEASTALISGAGELYNVDKTKTNKREKLKNVFTQVSKTVIMGGNAQTNNFIDAYKFLIDEKLKNIVAIGEDIGKKVIKKGSDLINIEGAAGGLNTIMKLFTGEKNYSKQAVESVQELIGYHKKAILERKKNLDNYNIMGNVVLPVTLIKK